MKFVVGSFLSVEEMIRIKEEVRLLLDHLIQFEGGSHTKIAFVIDRYTEKHYEVAVKIQKAGGDSYDYWDGRRLKIEKVEGVSMDKVLQLIAWELELLLAISFQGRIRLCQLAHDSITFYRRTD